VEEDSGVARDVWPGKIEVSTGKSAQMIRRRNVWHLPVKQSEARAIEAEHLLCPQLALKDDLEMDFTASQRSQHLGLFGYGKLHWCILGDFAQEESRTRFLWIAGGKEQSEGKPFYPLEIIWGRVIAHAAAP
jgi:hypothetical protein